MEERNNGQLNSLFSPQRMRNLAEYLSDIILLNIYWLVCSLPIVTIGASSAALYRSVYLMLKNEGSVTRNFFTAFRSNLRNATIVWCIALFLTAVMYFNYRLLAQISASIARFYQIAAVSIDILIVFLLQFLFPLMAQCHDTLRKSIKNAALMAVRHFPVTLIFCLLSSLPILCAGFIPHWLFQYGFIWMICGVCVTEIIKVKLFQRVLSRYIPQ